VSNERISTKLFVEALAQGRHVLDNDGIAELLAIEGDAAKPPLQKTFRRASRSAFFGLQSLVPIGFPRRNARNFLFRIKALVSALERILRSNVFRP
jgi:hypothetical protein